MFDISDSICDGADGAKSAANDNDNFMHKRSDRRYWANSMELNFK